MDVNTINATVRALVEDPNGDYADDPYLQPLLTLCYTEISNRLRLCNPDFDEYTVELPNVPAGTPDLSAFQATGQPLAFLIEPIRIEWKLPGQDPTYYAGAEKLNKIRDILIPGISAIDCWTWTHLTIFLSRFNVNLDIRVTGEFMFPPLSTGADTALIGLNALPAMSYAIATTIAMKRGNQQWVSNYGAKADENFDTLNISMCKGRQGKTERAGRMDRQRRRRGPGGNGIA
jgi:hypothetical protein